MNSLGYLGMNIADIMPLGNWGEKFVEAISPTIATLSITNYLASITPSNLYRRKENGVETYFKRNNIIVNFGNII